MNKQHSDVGNIKYLPNRSRVPLESGAKGGLGAFASVAGGAPDFVSIEENMVVLGEDAGLVFESEMVDLEVGSLTI